VIAGLAKEPDHLHPVRRRRGEDLGRAALLGRNQAVDAKPLAAEAVVGIALASSDLPEICTRPVTAAARLVDDRGAV
jgi:hypothetical protein